MGQASSKQESFFDACSFGREWLVKKLILEGIDVNWRSNIHDSYPIHVASQGKPEIVRILINAKCEIDARDIDGNTALHHAAMSGHANIAEILIDAGASVNASNHNQWTALMNAAYWNHPDVLDLLLRRGADPFWTNKEGRSALHELCRSKSERASNLLWCLRDLLACMHEIEQMNSPRTPKNSPRPGRSKMPVITEKASANFHPFMLDRCPWELGVSCLEIRSNPSDAWDSEADFTPVLFAAYHGHVELVRGLLDEGANIHALDRNGWTALHWAAQRSHLDVVCLLLKRGSNIRAKDSHGCLPYMVTDDPELKESLKPDAFYPHISSNGAVSTDEEMGSDTGSESHTPTLSRRQDLSDQSKKTLFEEQLSGLNIRA